MGKQPFRINNKTIYALLLLLCIIGFWIFENFYTPDNFAEQNSDVEPVVLADYIVPSSTTGEIIKHHYY
ncbi:MAG: DNA/RNA non-specific endonuclease, partial [Eudoraea sp.]|nr:DNA/RNA non-specific endonuclease [Eudoraea sp.]